MVSLTSEEEDVIQAIAACLSIAIAEDPELTPDDLNKTQTQKLLYLAIDEFDLDVTYSWYLAGSLVESSAVSPSNLETPDSPATPTEPSVTDDSSSEKDSTASSEEAEPPTEPDEEVAREFDIEREADSFFPEESTATETADSVSQPDPGPSIEDPDLTMTFDSDDIDLPEEVEVSVSDLVAFFKETLSNYPLTSTDRFLQHFYHYHAPDEYQELYESCLHVRSSLRGVRDSVRDVVEQGDDEAKIDKYSDEVGLHISDLHFGLYEREELRDTLTAVVRGTDIIEDSLMMLTRIDPDELRSEHIEAIEELQSFFYEWVWKYPALRISRETATGPSAEKIREAREATLAEFESAFMQESEEVLVTLDDAGLVPEYEDYPDYDRDSLNESISDLYSAYTLDFS